jgi:hypothetical protein
VRFFSRQTALPAKLAALGPAELHLFQIPKFRRLSEPPYYLPSSFCADRAVPKSREGRLRRDGVVVIVGDVLTANNHRILSVRPVSKAPNDAAKVAARDILGTATNARKIAIGDASEATAAAATRLNTVFRP